MICTITRNEPETIRTRRWVYRAKIVNMNCLVKRGTYVRLTPRTWIYMNMVITERSDFEAIYIDVTILYWHQIKDIRLSYT